MARQYKPLPAAERLHALLKYNPKTGVLTWRAWRGGRAHAGTVAGTRDKCGHIRVSIDGVKYEAHRLIWRMVTGAEPPSQVDHKNRDAGDNRLSNLRLASPSENRSNSASRGASGKKGAYRDGKKFMASITIDGVTRYLGTFRTAEEAHNRWWRETLRLRGEYARRE